MPTEVEFVSGTIVGAEFLNNQQEVDSGSADGVRLERASSTILRVPIGTDGSRTGQSGMRIDGTPRIIRAPLTLDMTGQSAGAYDIYAVIAGSTITAGFTLLAVVQGGSRPANSRKVGEAVWDGTRLVSVRNLIDTAGHGYLHRPGGGDALPTAAAVSLTAAGANSEGVAESFARSDHTHAITGIPATAIPDGSITGGAAGRGVKLAAATITLDNINPLVWGDVVTRRALADFGEPALVPRGYLGLATDLQGGALVRNNGTTWEQVGLGVGAASTALSDSANIARLAAEQSFTEKQTFAAGVSIANVTGGLDLTDATGSSPGLGNAIGDKIALRGVSASAYGFGAQTDRLVAFVPSGAAFAVRPASGTGEYSSGTDVFTITGAGAATAAGRIAVGAAISSDAFSARQVAANGVLANYLLSADTEPAFRVTGAGRLVWGPGGRTAFDVSLRRNLAGELMVGRDAAAAGSLALNLARDNQAADFTIYVPHATSSGNWVAGDVRLGTARSDRELHLGARPVEAQVPALRIGSFGDGLSPKLGFFGRAPQGRQTTQYTNAARLIATRSLPADFTLNDLASLVIAIVTDLGDTEGVGLVRSAY
jgi:hypothetical protein